MDRTDGTGATLGQGTTLKMNWLVLKPPLLQAVTVYVISAASSFAHPLINPLAGFMLRPVGTADSTLRFFVGKQDTVSPAWSTFLQGRSYVRELGGAGATLKMDWFVLSQLYCEQALCTRSRQPLIFRIH